MPVFDTLQRASFARIEFPISSCDVRGGIRDHMHEYPHASGAKPEKLGRKLYTISMKANFQATFKLYPNLWPQSLANLRNAFESQETDDLVIPTIGSIKAYCRNWSQQMDAKIQSGETADFEFVEDDSDNFLSAKDFTSTAPRSLKLQGEFIRLYRDRLEKYPGLFDRIQIAANEITGYIDRGEMFQQLAAARVSQMLRMVEEADRLEELQDVRHQPLVDALHDLGVALIKLEENVLQHPGGLHTYTVPAVMSVQQISIALYGNATRGMDILSLNPIEDAFAIWPGTEIRYYPDAKKVA